MMKKLLVICLSASLAQMAASASAQNIVFVGHNQSDVMPDQCVIDAGLTEAPDKPYTDLLSQFVNVERLETGVALDNATLDILNGADLVIISRAVSSGDYQDPPELEFWNTQVTSPIIIMSGYITRDSRLNFFNGGTMVDTDGAEKLIAVQPEHPVFTGIGLDGSNVMSSNFTDGLVDFGQANPAGVQRGISINNNEVVGGEVIARLNDDGGPGANGVMIAEWESGATLNNGTMTAGRRMTFLSGSREADGLCVPGAAGYDLTPAGEQMFLNAVDYMFPGGILGVPGDVNEDEVVNNTDFEIISGNFGQSPAVKTDGDLNRNNEVDLLDFRTWKANVPVAAASAANVPEPASIGLVLLGASMLGVGRLQCRRRG